MLPLGPRVKLPMHLLQAFLIDVGVDLRRGDVGVAEHFLDHAQVGTVVQQVGGEGVTK